MSTQRWLAGAGGALAIVVAVLLILPTLNVLDTSFSAYGSDEDDTSLLVNAQRAEGFEVASLTLGPPGLGGLDVSRTSAVYLAVGIDRGYTEPELDALMDFLEDGGRAIVLDDEGASDSLLARFDVTKGSRLLSTTGEQASVVRTEIAIGDLRRQVNLWEPVELDIGEDADVQVIASANNTTAKDTDANGEVTGDEPTCIEGCALAFRATVGDGSLTYVSDATFATNRFFGNSQVEGLVTSLAEEGAGGQRALIIVDESRHVAGPAEVGLTIFRTLAVPLGTSWVPWIASGLLALVAIVSLLRRSDEAWPEHDPGFGEPYLASEPAGSTTAEQEGEPT